MEPDYVFSPRTSPGPAAPVLTATPRGTGRSQVDAARRRNPVSKRRLAPLPEKHYFVPRDALDAQLNEQLKRRVAHLSGARAFRHGFLDQVETILAQDVAKVDPDPE